MKTKLSSILLLLSILIIAPALRAQQVTRINPSHITLWGVSLASLNTGMMVGDSNYVVQTHNAYTADTWQELTTGLPPSTTLYAVAYAGDTLHAVLAGENGALANTTDGGETWNIVPMGTTATIRNLSWNQSTLNPTLVGVGDGGLVIRSTDQGVTWKTISTPTTKQLNAVTFGTPTEGVAVGQDTTLIQTHDGGQTWSVLPFPYDFHTLYEGRAEHRLGSINFTSVAMAGADTVWVIVDTAMPEFTIIRGAAADTMDNAFNAGVSPERIENYVMYPHYGPIIYVGIDGFMETALGCPYDQMDWNSTPSDTDIYFTVFAIIGDADGNQNVTPVRTRAIAMWKQDTSLLLLQAGDDLSLYRYIHSPNSPNHNYPYPYGNIDRAAPLPRRAGHYDYLDVNVLPSGVGNMVSTGQFTARTTDYGKTWIPDTLQNLASNAALNTVYTLDDSTSLIAGWNGLLLRSDNAGTHVLQSGTQYRLHGIAFPSHDTGIVVGDDGYILRSTDRGGTWNSIPNSITSYLYSVAFVNSETGIATGDSATILRTTDAGLTWNEINYVLSGTQTTIRQVQAFPNGTFYAQAQSYLLRSVDTGKNWDIVLSPEDTLGMSFYNPQIGIIGQRTASSTGVVPDTAFVSFTTDAGADWTPVAVPLWNFNRVIFQWMNDHQVLLYGIYGWIVQLDIGSSGVTVTRIPSTTEARIFPNPTAGDFRVDYTTKASGPVQIQLWDEAGKQVGTLFSGEEAAGSHEQEFATPTDLHGSFFIRLATDGATTTSKLNIQ